MFDLLLMLGFKLKKNLMTEKVCLKTTERSPLSHFSIT